MVATHPLSNTACEPGIPSSNLDSITYQMSPWANPSAFNPLFLHPQYGNYDVPIS